MKDEFDHILKQLISGMPVHNVKPDTWKKINDRLDEDISISRLREKLNQKEHAPQTESWNFIETELNRSDYKRHFFVNLSFITAISLLVIISGVSLFLFFHKSSAKDTTAVTHRNNVEKLASLLKSADPSNNKDQTVASDAGVNNFDKDKNSKIVQINTFSVTKNKSSNDVSLAGNNAPADAQEGIQNNDTSMPSLDFDKSIPDPNKIGTTSISGKIIWWMIDKGSLSLYLYDENGSLVKTIFEKEKFDAGEQSYNFKLVNCNIEKGKTYFLRLMNKKVVTMELKCVAE